MSEIKLHDLAEVISNESGHGFEEGEIITIIHINKNGVPMGENQANETWWLLNKEIRKVDSELEDES